MNICLSPFFFFLVYESPSFAPSPHCAAFVPQRKTCLLSLFYFLHIFPSLLLNNKSIIDKRNEKLQLKLLYHISQLYKGILVHLGEFTLIHTGGYPKTGVPNPQGADQYWPVAR